MGWPVDPGSLTEELVRISTRYNKPDIYITENGACYDDIVGGDGQVHDAERTAYLRDHITVAQRALAAGVNLRGYFVWSLLDNFEWAEGYRRRFGIVRVDFTNLTRRPKASYQWLSEFIAQQKRR
jgi:beta-glucosidase